MPRWTQVSDSQIFWPITPTRPVSGSAGSLDKAALEDWTKLSPLGFGTLKASPRKMLIQAVLHSVHHRGQLATFLRQQGFKQDWTHDIILSKVME